MTNKAAQLACDWGQFAASEVFSEPEQLLAAFSSTPTVGFAIFDNQLRYQAVNQALVEINGIPADAHLGKTVRQVFGDAIAERVEPAFEHVLTTGQRLQFEITAKLPSRTEVGHWIDNCVPLRDATGTVRQLGVVVVEVTNRKRLEQSAPSLSSRLLRIRDTEQRRVARELHDSVNQNHAALKMNLGLLSRPRCKPADRESLLAQSVDLLEQCISKTRTISHLLHPPLLDEKGFASAARWYVKGFSQRSGIQVNVNCAPEQERMPVRVEIVYRWWFRTTAKVYLLKSYNGSRLTLVEASECRACENVFTNCVGCSRFNLIVAALWLVPEYLCIRSWSGQVAMGSYELWKQMIFATGQFIRLSDWKAKSHDQEYRKGGSRRSKFPARA